MSLEEKRANRRPQPKPLELHGLGLSPALATSGRNPGNAALPGPCNGCKLTVTGLHVRELTRDRPVGMLSPRARASNDQTHIRLDLARPGALGGQLVTKCPSGAACHQGPFCRPEARFDACAAKKPVYQGPNSSTRLIARLPAWLAGGRCALGGCSLGLQSGPSLETAPRKLFVSSARPINFLCSQQM